MSPYEVKLLIQYRRPIMQVVIGLFVFISLLGYMEEVVKNADL